MIQSISSPIYNTAPAAAAGMKELSAVQSVGDSPERLRAPVMDTYVPEEKQEPTGRYWLGADENGQPKVYFDDPEPKASDGEKAETRTGNTDQVDREIERLKKEKEQLEQLVNSETDDTKKAELEARLAQVELELSQKDNDTYRRQHTVFS